MGMLERSSTWSRALRLLVFALVLPLACSGALPVFARVVNGPAAHVCRCDVHHSTCDCPICHPERRGHDFGVDSIRGTCGDQDLAFGGATGLPLAIAEASRVTVLPAPLSPPAPAVSDGPVPDVTLVPPTPPPRSAAA
jgi:hypothetical protein